MLLPLEWQSSHFRFLINLLIFVGLKKRNWGFG